MERPKVNREIIEKAASLTAAGTCRVHNKERELVMSPFEIVLNPTLFFSNIEILVRPYSGIKTCNKKPAPEEVRRLAFLCILKRLNRP